MIPRLRRHRSALIAAVLVVFAVALALLWRFNRQSAGTLVPLEA